jgi:hypothetical protein
VATRKLEVVITGDASQLERTLGKVSDQASGFGNAMKKAALPATAALGAVAIGAKKTIDAASNLDEQMNKTAVVFGKNGTEVQQWSAGLTKNFGLSQRAALEAAGTYGNMLKPMGIIPSKVKEISTGMVELAGDMASFNNASPEETLDALRAGLAGETEPLRRFGVFLNEASVQAEALSSGIVKTTKDLTEIKSRQLAAADAMEKYTKVQKEHGVASEEAQKAAIALEIAEDKLSKAVAGKVPKLTAAEKALATYQIITKSTTDAQGDFARTSDSVANQQRIQAAETENLNAKIGQGLLPVYRTMQQVLLAVTGFLSEHTTATKVAVGVVASLAAGVLAVNAGMAVYRAAVAAATAAQLVFNAVLSANPIGVVIVAIAALAAGMVIAYQKSETFREVVDSVWKAIRRLGDWIQDNWGTISRIIENSPIVLSFRAWKRVIEEVVDRLDGLIDKVRSVISWLGKIDFPSVPGWLDPRNIGDPRDPTFTGPSTGFSPGGGGIDLMGARPEMMPFAVAAQGVGLRVTSGLRPGAITANGTPSDHGFGKALDVAGSASGMAAFFNSLLGNGAVKQAFYDPLGSIFGGRWSSYREGGHSDHVHVATYDKGGWLMPGLTLARNMTGRPERILGPGGGGNTFITVNMPNYVGDKREAARAIKDELQALDRVETGGRTFNSRTVLS